MEETTVCQGRTLRPAELSWLRSWVGRHGDWSRWKLAKELCHRWDWRTATGQIKSYAASSMLQKLESRGLIHLPPVRTNLRRASWCERGKAARAAVEFPRTAIEENLAELRPLDVFLCGGTSEERWLFERYLVDFHYLGFGHTVGEHLRYFVRDRRGRDLAVLLFGAPAWQLGVRDTHIGWDVSTRARNLNFLTNNTRYLVLPWVRVPHLATHILGLVLRRLCRDWQTRYGHPVHGVETFVHAERFKGTCYRASNWTYLGRTQGRGRQGQMDEERIPVKAVYFYPLHSRFQELLRR